MMNKEFILFNLKEASESLDKIITQIENNPEYSEDDSMYWVEIEHLYWHINTAWNARNSTSKESEECTQENFDKWNEFPADIKMNYE